MVDADGKPRFTIHDLRRSFVTDMLGVGSDPQVVQAMSGHRSLETLFRYYAAVRAKKAAKDIAKRGRYLNGE